MNRLAIQSGNLATKFKLPVLFGIGMAVIFIVYACGNDDVTGSGSFQCDVTLTLVPSRIGELTSPSGSGQGSGSGATQQEALSEAYKAACAQLNLSSDLKTRCEAGQDFGVSVTSGDITVVSVVERSQRCSGSTSN